MKKLTLFILLSLAVLSIIGCTKKDDANGAVVIKVGATPVPHAELLNVVKPLLKEEGIVLEIVEFTDYVTPNLALNDGEIIANFFQHVPYMNAFASERGLDLVSAGAIHVEPLGLYSKTFDSLEALPLQAQIAIPNDETNEGRALLLLQSHGVITLNDAAGLLPTSKDIIDNPKEIRIVTLDAAQLPRSLDDVDAAIINTNYALEAKLNPLEDAIILENEDSPYANIVTVLSKNSDNPHVLKLIDLLQSDKVRSFIEETYKGAVVPVF